jgi:hypothetical protein
VLTWQNDTYRTGDNLSESTITPSSIRTDNFGQLCAANLDGQVFAQPLVVTDVKIGSTTWPRVVYVVTQNDRLYAIDGDPQDGKTKCGILNGNGSGTSLLSFLPAGQSAVPCGKISDCGALNPQVGILGTPVINTSGSTGTMYLVTETWDGSSNYYHYLHAIDIGRFTEPSGSPVLIAPPGSTAAQAVIFSKNHIQRPGLLLANCGSGCNKNYVYIALSMIDGAGYPLPNGSIFGYDAATLSSTTMFYLPISAGLVKASNGGGVWMGGAAPAYGTDVSGNYWIYLTTANGTFDLSTTGGTNAGDSFLKLNPNGLAIDTSGSAGYFTPVDQYFRSAQQPTCPNTTGDTDFGSGGVMLVPDGELLNWQRLAVSGDKEGGLWFVDRTSPGGHNNNTSCANSCVCNQVSQDNNIQVYWTGTNGANQGPAIHTSPAYWEYDLNLPFVNYLYVTPQQGTSTAPAPLTRYPLCAKAAATSPIDFVHCGGSPVKAVDSGGHIINFVYGATPSISANGPNASDAIVWAINKPDGYTMLGNTQGVLYAIDAVSMTQLYSSANTCLSDAINPATKYSVPTVANGYAFLGTQSDNVGTVGKGTFYIFGPNRPAC